MIDCQSWQSEKKHIGFSTVHKSFNRDCAGPLILVGAPNPCVKLTLPSYLLTNNLLKLWCTYCTFSWLAVNDDYRMVCCKNNGLLQWLQNGLLQNGLLQWLQNGLQLSGTGGTAVTGTPHKEKLAFGSNNIQVVIRQNFAHHFRNMMVFVGGQRPLNVGGPGASAPWLIWPWKW